MEVNHPTDSIAMIETQAATHYTNLVCLIHGLVDSDSILPEDGSELLRSLEAASQLLTDGRPEAASRQLKHAALLVEELVRSDALDDPLDCVVLDAMRRIEPGQ